MRRVLIGLLLSAGFNAFATEMQIKISPEQIDNLAIKVGPVIPSQQVPLLSAPARVVVSSNREQLLTAPQSGFLTQLRANIGDKVSKGQILAQIHSPELLRLQQQFLTARSELNLVSLEQQRDQKLLEEGVIAQRRWQQTQALYNSKAAIAEEAKQLLTMTGMSRSEINALAKQHKLSSLLQVRSPIDGVVLDRLATLGTRLDMLTPIYHIADLSELWLEINIPQERITGVHLGDLVKVGDTDISASISLLGQSVNQANQTMLARAVVQNSSPQLRLGQNLTVQLMRNAEQVGFKVPQSAIAQNTGHNYVFVRNTQGFLVTEVTIAGKQDQDTLVSGPLNADMQIALQGTVALKANWLGLGGDE